MSSTTGEGLTDFFKAVEEARKEYIDDYRPELEKVVQERADKKEKEKRAQLDKMMKDMKLAKGKNGREKEVEEEGENDADLEPSYDGDGQLLDPVGLNLYECVIKRSFLAHIIFPLLYFLPPLRQTGHRRGKRPRRRSFLLCWGSVPTRWERLAKTAVRGGCTLIHLTTLIVQY